MTTSRRAGTAGLFLILASFIGACSAGAAPGQSSTAPSASPPPSAAPSAPSSDPDTGAVPPDSPIVGEPPPGGGGQPPDPGQPNLVVPKPGTIDPHPVAITQLVSQVDGRRVLLNARWWSGVEPCYVLDSVKAERAGNTFTISVFEGASEADAICIEIAMEKVTVIDLGELEPGTYIVQPSLGDAAAITVVVE